MMGWAAKDEMVTEEKTMEDANPIEESKKWLVECGYTETEAENLLRAIYHSDPEKLWELAPKWIEHVGEHKKYQHAMLDMVAQGLFSVTADETGEWCFSLNDRGMEVGRQMGLK